MLRSGASVTVVPLDASNDVPITTFFSSAVQANRSTAAMRLLAALGTVRSARWLRCRSDDENHEVPSASAVVPASTSSRRILRAFWGSSKIGLCAEHSNV